MAANTTGLTILNRPLALAADGNTRLVVVVSSSGVSNTKQIKLDDLLGNSTISVLRANVVNIQFKNTPAQSNTLTIAQGTIFYDDNFLYVATQNNFVKRIGTLSSF